MMQCTARERWHFAPCFRWPFIGSEKPELNRDAVLRECWDSLSEQTKRRIDERRWLEEQHA